MIEIRIRLISHLFVPVFLILSVIILLWIYFRYAFSYWHLRRITGPKPVWLFGNTFSRFFSLVSLAEFDLNLYQNYDGKYCCGLYEFAKPVLMIGSPNLLKLITIRDFDHFTDRSYFTFNEPVMDLMLLGLKGGIWKRVRSAMTPSFTSGKIKQTFPLVKDSTENLITFFHDKINSKCSTLEMKEVYGKFTMDTIASIAFGLSSQSFGKLQDEFLAAAAKFPKLSWQRPSQFINLLLHQMAKLLKLKQFDKTPFIFFSQVISDTIRYRLENNVRRTDFLQLLLDASLQEQVKLTNETGRNLPLDKKVYGLAISSKIKFCYVDQEIQSEKLKSCWSTITRILLLS